ncbi:glycosyltransferase [Vibrio lentus]
MKKIAICIATTWSRAKDIKLDQFPKHNLFEYVISCQGEFDECLYQQVCRHLNHIFEGNVSLLENRAVGLSNNRNLGLDHILKLEHVDFIYICDDDITLYPERLLELANLMFLEQADIGCGKIVDEGQNDFKLSYSSVQEELNYFTSARISSVEMMLSFGIIEQGVRFDNNFGLGTSKPSGEEYIFVTDALKKGFSVFYFPIKICLHPTVTSGSDFYSSPQKIRAKGAMFERIFGASLGRFFSILFSIKKYPYYKGKVGFLLFLKTIIST